MDDDSLPLPLKSEVQSYLPGMESEDFIIKKHNAIIHRTHASTPAAEKIFSGLLMAARSQLKLGTEESYHGFTTSMKFLKTFARMKATHNQIVKEALTSLQSHPWQYDLMVEDEEHEWRSFPPISEARIDRFGNVTFF